MDLLHPPSVARVRIYEKDGFRRTALAALCLAMYATVLPMVWNTMGEPRAHALEQIKEIEATKPANFGGANVWVGGKIVDESADEFGVDEVEDEVGSPASTKKKDKDDDWRKAFEGRKGESDEITDEEGRPLPSEYLPSALSSALLFGALTLTALFFLLCRWLVGFKALMLYAPSKRMRAGSVAFVEPFLHKGKAQLCNVTRSGRTDTLGFVFQRRRFEFVDPYDDEFDELTAELVGEGNHGAVRLISCPVDSPVAEYGLSSGLDAAAIEKNLELYGRNNLRIPPPKIHTLILQQMLSPIAMFQVFCAILWMLDEYWQYTIFTLFSIVALEATTAFQRLRTFTTLGNMASKPTPLQVYRNGAWAELTTEDLLPGDLVSLTRQAPAKKDDGKQAAAGQPDTQRGKKKLTNGAAEQQAPPEGRKLARPQTRGSDVVPCDLLVLDGSAVVNEATLTGESVPQMKDSIKVDEGDAAELARRLDIEGRDRVHTLFSGTTIVMSRAGAKDAHPIQTPDGGCLCYVLRTGFGSSQGELMQMIEFSTEQVSADSRETGLALLVLLCFALASAGYVLKKGLEKGDRTTHELLLKCVIIVTSVVPRQLPMQMAMAVNTALMALMKAGIFCTEPYRVPQAGKISHCLFDKTGTLTTDQLVPVGVVNNMPSAAKATTVRPRVDVNEARVEAAVVLGACHSLVQMEGIGVVGDPIEIAALKGVEWSYDADTHEASPGNWAEYEKAMAEVQREMARLTEGAANQRQPNNANRKLVDKAGTRLQELEKLIALQKKRAAASAVAAVKIRHRHHFSSELQRMSVVCDVRTKPGVPADAPVAAGTYCLIKGSPEMVKTLLAPGTCPAWYDASYNEMAEQGMRVLALAYKRCPPDATPSVLESRAWVESDLAFAGFIAFSCRTRSDSATVVRALKESDHGVAMLTGDAPLTALHVARQVGLCRSKLPATSSSSSGSSGSEVGPPLMLVDGEDGGFEWAGILKADEHVRVPLQTPGVLDLATKHDLVTNESVLEAAAEEHPNLWKEVEAIRVFSRCSPQGKARVIRALQTNDPNNHVLMCGDGGNDVGALKEASVGMALLSGYGNTNTTDNADNDGQGDGQGDGPAKAAEDQLNEQQKVIEKRSKEAAALRKKLMAQKQKELMSHQQEWVQEELKARAERGEDTGVMGMMAAVGAVTQRMKTEMAKEQAALNRKHGNVFDADEGDNADPLAGLDEAMPVVRPGDASIAAPFTSRTPSVRCVVTLIRQGRCTLLSALQQQQIMMLECIISAYALSALSLEGARSSERQMMASGWLIMTASLAFSYTKHIEEMHPVRPLRSLFHPAIFLSMLGQSLIHVGCMWYGVKMATEFMGPEALKAVLDFHKRAKARTLPEQQTDEDDPWAEIWNLWQTPFKPNLLNTVVFLVETSQMIAVLFVNYKGRPWMKGILENHPLFLSVFLCVAGVAACAWGISPEMNSLIHLEPFPTDEFRWKVMGLVGLSIVGTFVWDRFITAIFAPKVFGAMVDESKKTTVKDVMPVFATAGKVAVGFFVLATGNILVLGAIGYFYMRNRQQQSA